MPAKAPIYLKSGSGKSGPATGRGSKKLRELLSTEMISLPLGDFRHMAHVGRGGADDMFGDTTFLQEKNGGAVSNNEGTQTLGRNPSKRNKKKMRNHSVPDEAGLMEREVKSRSSHDENGVPSSPVMQSAFSLPLLNQQSSTSSPSSPTQSEGKGRKGKKSKKGNSTPKGKSPKHEPALNDEEQQDTATHEDTSDLPMTPKKPSTDDESQGNGRIGNGKVIMAEEHTSAAVIETKEVKQFSDTTSISEGWALELDLGTSLMDDVMGIMDKIEL